MHNFVHGFKSFLRVRNALKLLNYAMKFQIRKKIINMISNDKRKSSSTVISVIQHDHFRKLALFLKISILWTDPTQMLTFPTGNP